MACKPDSVIWAFVPFSCAGSVVTVQVRVLVVLANESGRQLYCGWSADGCRYRATHHHGVTFAGTGATGRRSAGLEATLAHSHGPHGSLMGGARSVFNLAAPGEKSECYVLRSGNPAAVRRTAAHRSARLHSFEPPQGRRSCQHRSVPAASSSEPPASVGLACRPVGAWRRHLVKGLQYNGESQEE